MRWKRTARKKRWRALCAVGAVTLFLISAGCAMPTPGEPEVPEPVSYTKAQIMIIATTERNRYEQVYTDRIWDAVMENGETFEEYLLDEIRVFMENLKTMTLLAQDRGITLSSGEQDKVRRLARNYYSGLSRAEIEYMGITEEDVAIVYQDYYTANKVVEELTAGVDLEVSDSEAKVISIRRVCLPDRETAEALRGRLLEEGSDFGAEARSVTGSTPPEEKIWRGEEPALLEEAAFSLASGEISQVIQLEDGFYLVQCVSDYEMDATRERKTQIYKERKNWAFQQIYGQFQTEHKVSIPDEVWSEISFEGGEESVTSDFFSLYQEEFG
ncbi:MAG: peptidylprolyl isomerase [Hungatella sp.]|nr:peptidylprolyl isomerase [Hungatella sp.]